MCVPVLGYSSPPLPSLYINPPFPERSERDPNPSPHTLSKSHISPLAEKGKSGKNAKKGSKKLPSEHGAPSRKYNNHKLRNKRKRVSLLSGSIAFSRGFLHRPRRRLLPPSISAIKRFSKEKKEKGGGVWRREPKERKIADFAKIRYLSSPPPF